MVDTFVLFPPVSDWRELVIGLEGAPQSRRQARSVVVWGLEGWESLQDTAGYCRYFSSSPAWRTREFLLGGLDGMRSTLPKKCHEVPPGYSQRAYPLARVPADKAGARWLCATLTHLSLPSRSSCPVRLHFPGTSPSAADPQTPVASVPAMKPLLLFLLFVATVHSVRALISPW